MGSVAGCAATGAAIVPELGAGDDVRVRVPDPVAHVDLGGLPVAHTEDAVVVEGLVVFVVGLVVVVAAGSESCTIRTGGLPDESHVRGDGFGSVPAGRTGRRFKWEDDRIWAPSWPVEIQGLGGRADVMSLIRFGG